MRQDSALRGSRGSRRIHDDVRIFIADGTLGAGLVNRILQKRFFKVL